MESNNVKGKNLEIFEVGPCENAYQMGFMIGQRFSKMIKSRLATDLILQNQLLPFAQTPKSQPILQSLAITNKKKFPEYWDELLGTADGSGSPFLEIMLLNFRKEILPFVPQTTVDSKNDDDTNDDCSDILLVSDSMAVAAHNEDANVALVGHTYLIKGILSNGISFIAYTYAGELPSCAFGFNSLGMAFTLNSVPPTEEEIVAGAIGRNFVSRDLLEAQSIDDALKAHDDNSLCRGERAALLPKRSKSDFLSLLGNNKDAKYPIYMTGPLLYTLCTAVIDLDEQTFSIMEGNPKETEASFVFSMSLRQ
ncbi:uncharacterized protein LOC111398572 isoform X2 [Olea europaea var. sylvestris]|uniref:uncharacterized protein LOC111398572 isoform X2 n=1 Tax=Olea europaea var. sylvestris TaxID=158386 RepID=UPI000C1D659E|nr:uncharacterized protein LOC111398572 isoform X2 [Olea europaea var. sylvestris]